jgi:hypothetical protein
VTHSLEGKVYGQSALQPFASRRARSAATAAHALDFRDRSCSGRQEYL